MYHFFVEQNQINDTSVIITGDDVNHIKNVIRLKTGDEISVSNGTDGKDYRCGAIHRITGHMQAALYQGGRRRAARKGIPFSGTAQRR